LWLTTLVLAGPLLWLTLLQVNYVLAYPTCAERSNAWIYFASAIATVVTLSVLYAARSSWHKEPPELRAGEASLFEQREPDGRDPATASRFFLALFAVLMAVLFMIVVIGTAVPPVILHPCD
jgi:hypothetical protein